MKKSPKRPPVVIGWREWIALPDLGPERLKAKIDTGARTSALHATHVKLRPVGEDGVRLVDFRIPSLADPRGRPCTARLVDRRHIKNTSGEAERRLVVQTRLILGGQIWPIEVSLANREAMTFDLILGRTAIRRRGLLVDPGRSFLAGPPEMPELNEQTQKDRAPKDPKRTAATPRQIDQRSPR